MMAQFPTYPLPQLFVNDPPPNGVTIVFLLMPRLNYSSLRDQQHVKWRDIRRSPFGYGFTASFGLVTVSQIQRGYTTISRIL